MHEIDNHRLGPHTGDTPYDANRLPADLNGHAVNEHDRDLLMLLARVSICVDEIITHLFQDSSRSDEQTVFAGYLVERAEACASRSLEFSSLSMGGLLHEPSTEKRPVVSERSCQFRAEYRDNARIRQRS